MAAAKKGGLGKGIDSLIPNKVSATKTEAKNENAKNDKVIEGALHYTENERTRSF